MLFFVDPKVGKYLFQIWLATGLLCRFFSNLQIGFSGGRWGHFDDRGLCFSRFRTLHFHFRTSSFKLGCLSDFLSLQVVDGCREVVEGFYRMIFSRFHFNGYRTGSCYCDWSYFADFQSGVAGQLDLVTDVQPLRRCDFAVNTNRFRVATYCSPVGAFKNGAACDQPTFGSGSQHAFLSVDLNGIVLLADALKNKLFVLDNHGSSLFHFVIKFGQTKCD